MANVELLSLSNFKLQLLSLVAQIRQLRETERSATHDLQLCAQRQKELQAEYGDKLRELQAEIALRDQSNRTLEAQIKHLETDREMFEKKEKELKETIDSLLQSREAFLQHYEDSSCLLKQTIQKRDKSLAVLSEKIHAHISFFNSIEKEVAAVKGVVRQTENLVNEKEQVVAELKKKLDRIPMLENDFVQKIVHLEKKVSEYEVELRHRDVAISELKEHIEMEKVKCKLQPRVQELQNTLSVKEKIIVRLTSEKQAMQLELKNLEFMLEKIQEAFLNISTKDQEILSSVLETREKSRMNSGDKNDSVLDDIKMYRPCSLDCHSLEGAISKAVAMQTVEHHTDNSLPSDHVAASTLVKPFVSLSPSLVSTNAQIFDVCPKTEDIEMGERPLTEFKEPESSAAAVED